jgi:hypothetical protein
VKLIKRDESHYTFVIGKRERELLNSLLQRYPVLKAGHFRTRQPAASDDSNKDQELLEQALLEQQKDNKKQLEQVMNQPGRFSEHELGYTFRLNDSELEWLLQVLNDIRVGSWVELGEPDNKSSEQVSLSERNMPLVWAMEMSGLFQNALLEATRTAG